MDNRPVFERLGVRELAMKEVAPRVDANAARYAAGSATAAGSGWRPEPDPSLAPADEVNQPLAQRGVDRHRNREAQDHQAHGEAAPAVEPLRDHIDAVQGHAPWPRKRRNPKPTAM